LNIYIFDNYIAARGIDRSQLCVYTYVWFASFKRPLLSVDMSVCLQLLMLDISELSDLGEFLSIGTL